MPTMGERAEALARQVVERLFLKSRVRLGLTTTPKGDRRLMVEVNPRLTLPSLYEAAVRAGGGMVRQARVSHIRRIAQGYLQSQKENAVAAVSRTVGGIVAAAELGSRMVPDQVRKDVLAAVDAVIQRLTPAVERIVGTEAVAARNLGDLEIVERQGQQAGQSDPLCFCVIVRDGKCCGRCRRVHLMEDGVTPRVYHLSEVSQTYSTGAGPSTFGQHPRCRCKWVSILPGYGFSATGMVQFRGSGYDVLKEQRA